MTVIEFIKMKFWEMIHLFEDKTGKIPPYDEDNFTYL